MERKQPKVPVRPYKKGRIEDTSENTEEDERVSLLQVIRQYFEAAGRVKYIHRLIYIGKHTFRDSESSIKHFFQDDVQTLNEEDGTEPLTGFLLYYTSYFIHFLEGPEELISTHVLHLLDAMKEGKETRIGKIRVLLITHHIKQRYFHQWAARPAKPPTLLSNIEPTDDMEECVRQIKICINKLYKLGELLLSQSAGSLRLVMDRLSEKAMAFLPEHLLLDFLIDLEMLPSLEDYVEPYMKVPVVDLYEDAVWPVGYDFIPYKTFDKPCEPEYSRNKD